MSSVRINAWPGHMFFFSSHLNVIRSCHPFRLSAELVGEGSFGKVYKARRKFTGRIVAMKFIMKHGKSEKVREAPPRQRAAPIRACMHADHLFYRRPQDIRSLRQEIEILRGLKHEHIIEMSDAFETKSEFCVVTEFAQGELFEARCGAAALKDKRMCQASSPRFWRTTRIYRRSRSRCRTIP